MSEEKRVAPDTEDCSYLFLRRYQPDQVLRDRFGAGGY